MIKIKYCGSCITFHEGENDFENAVFLYRAKDAIQRSRRLRLKRGKQTIKIRFDDEGNPIREERVVQILDKVKGLLDSTLDSEDFLTAEEDELEDDNDGRIDDDDDDFHDALEEFPDDKGDNPAKKLGKKKVRLTKLIL